MKLTSEVIKKAHKLTKEIKTQYPEVDYKAQLGICLSFLLSEKEGVKEVVNLKGTEKQMAWASSIREEKLSELDNLINSFKSVEKIANSTSCTRVINKIEGYKKVLESKESCNFWISIKERKFNNQYAISQNMSNKALNNVEQLTEGEERVLGKMFSVAIKEGKNITWVNPGKLL